jgi:uncharacterized SAM-binding protein YcdF (DUF218 family)
MRRAGLLAALGFCVAGALLVAYAGRFLEVRDPLPAAADAIVIMAGSLADRSLAAADLYHAGLAPRVVVTREQLRSGEAALHARGVTLPENHDLTITALEALGIPRAAIVVLTRRNDSTESEARTIARWACRRRSRHLIVVTSRPHARRARRILREALGPAIALSLAPTRYDPFQARRWWRDRRSAKFVWWEYEKLLHYWLREHWQMEPCGGLLRRQAGS